MYNFKEDELPFETRALEDIPPLTAEEEAARKKEMEELKKIWEENEDEVILVDGVDFYYYLWKI